MPTSLKLSGLPLAKTLDTLDFAFQACLDNQIGMLGTSESCEVPLAARLGVRQCKTASPWPSWVRTNHVDVVRWDEAADGPLLHRRK